MVAAKKQVEATDDDGVLVVKKLNILTVQIPIVGTAPYVQNKFSAKGREQYRKTQEAGQQAKSKKQREPKDFQATYEAAIHWAQDDKGKKWMGLPAPAIRKAMIDACRLIGYHMTTAKMSVFVVADGVDIDDGTPLVKIEGKPERVEHVVRNETGTIDIRWRPMWREWTALLTLRFDADQFSVEDVHNLLRRAGVQVGIGEGRPFSKKSAGMGWGTFDLKED
jgi:hypothetical protein